MNRWWAWINPRTAPWLLLTGVVAAGVGMTLTAASTPMPGSDRGGAEDVVDAVADVLLGGLGVLLIVRDRAAGLGRGLVLATLTSASGAILGGVADFATDGGSPSVTAQVLTVVSGALFVPGFALTVLSPLLLFPTGHLPSPRWLPVAAAAMSGVAVSVLTILLAPGPVDEDVLAWGTNPMGIDFLGPLQDTAELVGVVLLASAALAGVVAVVVRLVRYRGRQRRQMLWFLAAVVPLVVGLLTEWGDSALVQTLTAVVIFSGLLFGIGWPTLGPLGRPSADPSRRRVSVP
jgi:hypothetical protein